MTVTFNNLTVSIEADTPKAAYTRLCDLLDKGNPEPGVEWYSDTYCRDDEPEQHDTSLLMED